MIEAGQYNISVGAGQPGTTAKTISGTFTISGEMKLPE
jgi:hypothetical protein